MEPLALFGGGSRLALGHRAAQALVADISVPETWQGKGFFQALIAALSSPQQGIDLIELENVINQRLARHLERYGWISRNGMAIGGLLGHHYRRCRFS